MPPRLFLPVLCPGLVNLKLLSPLLLHFKYLFSYRFKKLSKALTVWLTFEKMYYLLVLMPWSSLGLHVPLLSSCL